MEIRMFERKDLKAVGLAVVFFAGQYHACAALEPQVLPMKQMISALNFASSSSTFSGASG